MDLDLPSVPEVTSQDTLPPEMPDSSSQKPKDSHWITIVSMAVFVLLSLAAVVFLYDQNQQLKGSLATYQIATPSPSPTLIATPLASSSATPKSTCIPRPKCLDQTPKCEIAETINMCPPSPTP